MPHTQFVKCIGIHGRDVGHDDIGGKQLLIHRNIDNPGVYDFIGAHALETGRFDSRLDEILIRLIQVEFAAGLIIRFYPEAHYDEARTHSGPQGYHSTAKSYSYSFAFAGMDSRTLAFG